MDIITVNGFEKSYGSFKAVKGISFKVKEGSLFAFLGPSPQNYVSGVWFQ